MAKHCMWYVIFTPARNEQRLLFKIEKLVEKEDYEKAWIPQRLERRKMGEEWEDIPVKLFPGYVFVETNAPEKIMEALKREPEFVRFLGTEKTPLPVRTEEQAIISRLTGEDGVSDVSTGILKEGKLHIIEGPLRELEPYIIKTDRHKRKAYLEMELFGEVRRFVMGLEILGKY